MKISYCKLTLFTLVLMILGSCDDDNFFVKGITDDFEQVPDQSDVSVQAFHYSLPVALFEFYQTIRPEDNTEEIRFRVTNLRNTPIGSMEFFIKLYSTNTFSFENQEFEYRGTISDLNSGDTSNLILINQTYNKVIQADLIEVEIISFEEDVEFNDVYRGQIDFFRSADSIRYEHGQIHASIGSDGNSKFMIQGESLTKVIRGNIFNDSLFIGKAFDVENNEISTVRNDTTDVIRFILEESDSILFMNLKYNDTSSTEGTDRVILKLKRDS